MESRNLIIKGARVHNLQNVSLVLPRHELICFTGVSGSGKSSLAFDTIYAEGQRRYVESLSAYARQFLGQMEKPDVDLITGLSPTISIEQKTAGRNPRSTVGTMTEIYDYLRVLFARIGIPHCIHDNTPIGAQTRDGIVDRIMALGDGTRILVLASVVKGRKGEYLDLFEDLQKEGYIRVRVDGQVMTLAQVPKLARYKRHDIEVVIDRLVVKQEGQGRIGEAVDAGLLMGKGSVIISPEGGAEAGARCVYARPPALSVPGCAQGEPVSFRERGGCSERAGSRGAGRPRLPRVRSGCRPAHGRSAHRL